MRGLRGNAHEDGGRVAGDASFFRGLLSCSGPDVADRRDVSCVVSGIDFLARGWRVEDGGRVARGRRACGMGGGGMHPFRRARKGVGDQGGTGRVPRVLDLRRGYRRPLPRGDRQLHSGGDLPRDRVRAELSQPPRAAGSGRPRRPGRHRRCGGGTNPRFLSASVLLQPQRNLPSHPGNRSFPDFSLGTLFRPKSVSGSEDPLVSKTLSKLTLVSFLLIFAGPVLPQKQAAGGGQVVNDVHSRLNETRVARIATPASVQEVQEIVAQARKEGRAISIAGGRHAMGGQQFGTDTVLLDTSKLNRVVAFDEKNGFLTVQAGIRWPELLDHLEQAQKGKWPQWGIRQKQTGADRLSIGGALAANAHGRGLRFKPMVADVESFTLVDAQGRVLTCSRKENRDLFRLAIGGYGLFGVIAEVKLRLMPRTKLERTVQVIDVAELVPAVEKRIADGTMYGDFQFDINPRSEHFLTRGVFSTYKPVDPKTPIPPQQRQLRMSDWADLFYLAHTDKKRAFDAYSKYYLTTNGQIYWSDTHQLAEYLDEYHIALDKRLRPEGRGTESISEGYVLRENLVNFLKDVGKDLRSSKADVIYGTVRFIEPDDESFLPWARRRYVSIIFNLHTAHTPAALEKTAADFRQLIERAIQYGGRYYLTYHHSAPPKQGEKCYPQILAFLKEKRKFDPDERFQSDWYRFYRKMFADAL